jgi:hypothetical protein
MNMSSERINLAVQPALARDRSKANDFPFSFVVGLHKQSNGEVVSPHSETSVGIEIQNESITLPSDKAIRLINIFRKLDSDFHNLDCHDFMYATEGWEDDMVVNNRIMTSEEPIVSGNPYQILINVGTNNTPEWLYTHSAIGTDERKLLAVGGLGLALCTMDRETAMQIYNEGFTPYLATVSVSESGDPKVLLPGEQ